MAKLLKKGDGFSFKTKKDENDLIIEWLNIQTNRNDSLRYLIEEEIKKNGLRNLQKHIPSIRVLDLEKKDDIKAEPVTIKDNKLLNEEEIEIKAEEKKEVTITKEGLDDKAIREVVTNDEEKNIAENVDIDIIDESSKVNNDLTNDEKNDVTDNEDNRNTSKKVVFDEDDIESWM